MLSRLHCPSRAHITPVACLCVCQQEQVYGRRVVFFGASEEISEPKLLQLFSKHGDVTGLFVVRSALGLPCGCGYVTMATPQHGDDRMLSFERQHRLC